MFAPGLIVERNGKSVFARQPETQGGPARGLARRARVPHRVGRQRNEAAAPWRQDLSARPSPTRCGDAASTRAPPSARTRISSRGPGGNLLVDSPRYAGELVTWIEQAGGIAHILLSHQDDVADAGKFAVAFGARVWIHRDDSHAPRMQAISSKVNRNGRSRRASLRSRCRATRAEASSSC
jgi:hypothetical protein